MFKHLFKSLLIYMLIIAIVASLHVFAIDDALHIKTVDDFMKFSQQCALFSYSEKLNVILDTDIDLTGIEFKGIPSFSGTLDGNHHTIKGLEIDQKGSAIGLFRYIEPNGIVKNLKVKGKVKATGSAIGIGGIVGINRGLVVACKYTGDVEGVSQVGGVAGGNQEHGKIINCSSYGIIYGDRSVGGSIGFNQGAVEGIENYAEVCTRAHDRASIKIKEFDVHQLFENDVIHTVTDIGGVVGLNQGRILSVKNFGNVGYPHMGYNVGGIAGRQSGYIRGVMNSGTIYGRKDVGGIVGQAEPDLNIHYKREVIDQIGTELDLLQTELNMMLDHSDVSNQKITNQLKQLSQAVQNANEDFEKVYDGMIDFSEDTSDTINSVTENIDSIIDDSVSVIETLKQASQDASDGFGAYKNGFNELAKSSSTASEGIDQLSESMASLEDGFNALESGFNELDQAVKILNQAASDNQNIEKAYAEFIQAIESLKKGTTSVEKALNALNENLSKYANTLPNITSSSAINVNDIINNVPVDTPVNVSLDDFSVAFDQLSRAITYAYAEYNNDMEAASRSMDEMSLAMLNFSHAMKDLNNSIQSMSDDMSYFSLAFDELSSGMGDFERGTAKIEDSTDAITRAMDRLETIATEQSNRNVTKFSGLRDYIAEPGDALFNSLSHITNEFNITSDVFSDTSSTMIDDIRTISDRTFKIAGLMQEGVSDISTNWEDFFVDDSEQALKKLGAQNGLIQDTTNTGCVEADINVGGIAGTQGVEVEADPESEYSWLSDSNIVTAMSGHAAIARSKNQGNIIAKKDNVGGIIGEATIGLIMLSENYGDIESETGSYVGGIAGYADIPIRKSYVMAHIKGLDYLGGIAGYGTEISDTKAIPHISLTNNDDGHERIGAVAGYSDLSEYVLNDNYFVSDNLHGIDSISYANQAKPITYNEFIKDPLLPNYFKSLSLTFKADNQLIAVFPFEYGDSADRTLWPKVPGKDGFFGSWSTYTTASLTLPEQINAIYQPQVTTIASSVDTTSSAAVLVEGKFTDKDSVTAEKMNMPFNQNLLVKFWQKTAVDIQMHIIINDVTGLNEVYRYHIRVPNKQQHIAYLKHQDGWIKLDTDKDGSYLVFDSDESDIIVTLVQESANQSFIKRMALMTGGVILIIIILGFLIKVLKRRHKTKNISN